jgi:hypothetical protein
MSNLANASILNVKLPTGNTYEKFESDQVYPIDYACEPNEIEAESEIFFGDGTRSMKWRNFLAQAVEIKERTALAADAVKHVKNGETEMSLLSNDNVNVQTALRGKVEDGNFSLPTGIKVTERVIEGAKQGLLSTPMGKSMAEGYPLLSIKADGDDIPRLGFASKVTPEGDNTADQFWLKSQVVLELVFD